MLMEYFGTIYNHDPGVCLEPFHILLFIKECVCLTLGQVSSKCNRTSVKAE